MAPQAKKAGSATKSDGAASAPAASAEAAGAGAGAGKRKRGRGRGNRKRGGRRAAAASSASESDSSDDSDDESSEAESDEAEPVASTSKTASIAATAATTKSTPGARGAATSKTKSDKKGKGRASDDESSRSDDDSDEGSSSDASSSSFLTTSSEEEADEDDAAPSQAQSAQPGYGASTNTRPQSTLAGGEATRRPEMTRPPSPPYIQFGADADLSHNVRAFGKPILWGLLPGDMDAPPANMTSAELARIEDEKKAASERYTRFRDHYVTRMVSCFGGALDSVRQKEADTMTPNRLEVLIASIGAGADLFTSKDAARQGIWRTKEDQPGERELVLESLDTVTGTEGQTAAAEAHDEEMQL